MDDTLSNPTENQLGDAVKANLFAFFRYLGRSAATHLTETARLWRWHTPVAHPWFRGVLSLAAAEADEGAAINAAIAYFRERQASPFTWWLAPGVPAEGWDRQLRAHGFGHDASAPGMALKLDALPDTPPLPAGLDIRPVEDAETLRLWNRIFVAGYVLPAEVEAPFSELLAGLGLDWPIRHYLGFVDGQPAATSSVFRGAGVAGIYYVATLPWARGRGVGGAMTLWPLYAARATGCQVGILQSSEMGFQVYLRLGFEVVCTVDNYYKALDP